MLQDLATTPAVMKSDLMNSVGVQDAKPSINRNRNGAAHAAVVQMKYKADILERGLDEIGTGPPLQDSVST